MTDVAREQPILRLNKVSKHFGGLIAVNELSMEIYPGQIVGIIGPNGAGKTTVFNLISGISKATSGEVEFSGKVITHLNPFEIARAGMARTFQEIHLFKGMSVLENIKAAGFMSTNYSLFEAFLPLGRVKRQEKSLTERSLELLDRFGLREYLNHRADDLPYGFQKRLEIAKALITNPRLVLLDEPMAGLNTEETLELMQLIRKIRDEFNLTILVIEHAMEVIQEITDYIVVVNFGQKLADGTWEEIRQNEQVISCYLGEENPC